MQAIAFCRKNLTLCDVAGNCPMRPGNDSLSQTINMFPYIHIPTVNDPVGNWGEFYFFRCFSATCGPFRLYFLVLPKFVYLFPFIFFNSRYSASASS